VQQGPRIHLSVRPMHPSSVASAVRITFFGAALSLALAPNAWSQQQVTVDISAKPAAQQQEQDTTSVQRTAGTLFVVLFGENQIVIATDSRQTETKGSTSLVRDGVEKIVELQPTIAFLPSGLDRLRVDDDPVFDAGLVARRVFDRFQKSGAPLAFRELAIAFGKEVCNELSRLPQVELLALKEEAERLEASILLESAFVGADVDGELKLLAVRIRLEGLSTPAGSQSVEPMWHLGKPNTHGTTYVRFLGAAKALEEGLSNPNAPLLNDPEYKGWIESRRRGKELDPVLTAEALAKLVILHANEESRKKVGFPIFVYSLNMRDGLKRVKVTRECDAAQLPN
ncbi:MAG: hypothetical protein ACRD2L_24650, partial [Terriglobia bacterium]